MKKPIVIVGAGTVGLMLAHELVLQQQKVIVIEAGKEMFDFFDKAEYKSIGKEHSGVQYGRAKGVGGTSNLWGGQLTEFIPADFEAIASYKQPSWPIDWDVIQHYYSKVYTKLGFTPAVPFKPQILYSNEKNSLEIFCSRWIPQPNFKMHFWNTLKKSELVTFYTNSIVKNLEFKDNKCIAIKYLHKNVIHELTDFEDVILANGSIEIIRLLLYNVKTNKAVPFASNKNIGLYFQDHLNFKIGEVQGASKNFLNRFSNFFEKQEKLQPKLRININKKNYADYLGVCGFFSYESNVSEHIYVAKQFAKSILGKTHQKVKFVDLCKMFFKLLPALPQLFMLVFNYVKNNRIYIPFNSKIKLIINTQQISIKESNVSIEADNFDNNGLPKVIVNWNIDGREIEGIKVFCELLRAYLEENKLGILKYDDWFVKQKVENDKSWINNVTDVYHQAGGAIMSKTSEEGVVDLNLKVHNTDNLYVCGACVMPTSSYGNITLTALALALRLTDYLKNK
ncbi:MAG: GMC oxidoreductase [Chitinophagaceae bacterium]